MRQRAWYTKIVLHRISSACVQFIRNMSLALQLKVAGHSCCCCCHLSSHLIGLHLGCVIVCNGFVLLADRYSSCIPSFHVMRDVLQLVCAVFLISSQLQCNKILQLLTVSESHTSIHLLNEHAHTQARTLICMSYTHIYAHMTKTQVNEQESKRAQTNKRTNESYTHKKNLEE